MIHYAQINTEQQKQLDQYIVKLGITTDGERFVLEHILKRDWGRDILLQDIEMIKYNHPKCTNLVWVKCTTRNGSYNFSVSHIGTGGWTTTDIEEQKNYVSSCLYHKMD
jgi:hypothetical protein